MIKRSGTRRRGAGRVGRASQWDGACGLGCRTSSKSLLRVPPRECMQQWYAPLACVRHVALNPMCLSQHARRPFHLANN